MPGAGDQQVPSVGASQNIFSAGDSQSQQQHSALQTFIENSSQQRQKARNPAAATGIPIASGSISGEIVANRRSSAAVDLNESQSATQSVSEHDDIASLTAKFKALRRENAQLRSLLRQNELIIQQNIEQLKQEQAVSLRLCQAFLPLIKRFSQPPGDSSAS